MTTVSVVIATRNRREMLSEAIATVREQTFAEWELIVVDDASTDDTVAWLRSQPVDQRIQVHAQPTHGERSAARNRGLELATGIYVMFLDDDDLLRADALANLVAGMRAHPAAVGASGACRILQANGDSVKVYHPSRTHCGYYWREVLFGWWANSGQNLYRTDVVRAVGGFDAAITQCEDRKLRLAVARRGPLRLVPNTVMEYRQHAGQHKPPDLDAIRERVWQEFIAGLPQAEQGEARRIRRAAEMVQRSETARAAGRRTEAIAAQLQAMKLAPALLRSPLTARPLWWGLRKSL